MKDRTADTSYTDEQRILVLRFSALGDVALLVPVFRTLEHHCPHLKIDLATQPAYHALFAQASNVHCLDTDIYGRHRGLHGHWEMFHEISKTKYDAIIDLHDVLRTRLLTGLFKLRNQKVITYDKQRVNRWAAVAHHAPEKVQGHVVEHYLAAFRAFGAPRNVDEGPWLNYSPEEIQNTIAACGLGSPPTPWVGVAPFSVHRSKEWNQEHVGAFLTDCISDGLGTFFCLAFGRREEEIAAGWKSRLPALQILSSTTPLQLQLQLIAAMKVLVTMDSANLHLASLTGTPTVSLWGGTHPAMGFGPLGKHHVIVQPSAEDAPWRPLSVYGKVNKRDLKRAEAAMALLTPGAVYKAVQAFLD